MSRKGFAVADRVFGAMPWTVLLVLSGILVSFLIGVVLGVVAALKRSTAVGHSLSIAGSLLHGVPPFVIAIILAAAVHAALPMVPQRRAVQR